MLREPNELEQRLEDAIRDGTINEALGSDYLLRNLAGIVLTNYINTKDGLDEETIRTAKTLIQRIKDFEDTAGE